MAKSQNKSSKIGRQKKSGQNLRYFNEDRHTKSHIRRIKKHLLRFPSDISAVDTMKYYAGKIGDRNTGK